MTDCKKCLISIGSHDLILTIDEKIIFHVIVGVVGGEINPEDVIDKIQRSLLEYVNELVKSK